MSTTLHPPGEAAARAIELAARVRAVREAAREFLKRWAIEQACAPAPTRPDLLHVRRMMVDN